MGFLTPAQRAALAASSAEGPPLSAFASPPASPGKVRRVRSLATSPTPQIRESAALSAHAPADLLELLAGDVESGVRTCVARNAGTAEAVLRRLAVDDVATVRGWVAAHPHCPRDLLDDLARDDAAQVRAVVGWARGWGSR